MATQICPKCGKQFPTGEGWAKAAVSLLVPAPAVPDMATQVRCPGCHHLFAAGEVQHLAASRGKLSRLLVVLACLSIAAWAAYRFF